MGADHHHINAAQALVAKALSTSMDRIGSETKMFGLPAWDSFGQLSIVLAIEEELGTRIDDEPTFSRLTSVRGIAAYLATFRRKEQKG
jgi:acyl carrier protein